MNAGTSRLSASERWRFGQYNATPLALADGDAAPVQLNIDGSAIGSTYDRQRYSLTRVEGTLGGPPIAVDPDPNTVDPGARAVRLTQATGRVNGDAAGALVLQPMDGTSLQVAVWFLEDGSLGRWIRYTPPASAPALALTILATLGNFAGAKFFPQITANAGGVTQYYWLFR